MKKRVVSLFLAVLMASCSIPNLGIVTQAQEIVVESNDSTVLASAGSTKDYGLADNIQDGVILHCFDWKYNDIKAELKNIAEAGFTAVQTSPAQRDDSYGVWYMLYQPQSFSITTNALGSKEELKSLCDEAEKYGIKIIVDVVANHMRGDGNNVDDSMKKSNHSDYWHHDNLDTNNIDWTNRYQVTHGRIGMYDLNSENSSVQNIIAGYIRELKSVGVDGIRWDAAKHIGLPSENCGFWPAVTGEGLYNYGEILKGPDDRESGNEGLMKEYTNYMSVTDSDYGKTLRDAFNSGSVPSAYGNWCARGVANNKLVYWGESHDTWSNNKDWGYSNDMSQNVIDRAYAVAASRNGISALYFSRPDSKVKTDIKAGQKGSTHFTSAEVAAINHFHNAMIGQKDYYTSSNGCAVVCREEGAVIVKGSGSGQVSVKNGGSTTKLGTYIDEITGNEWTVTSTTISGTIGSSGIAVVYNPKPIGPSASVTPDTTTYKTDTLTLTLSYKNATNGFYAIDDGEFQSFTDGDKIVIGKDLDYGTKTKITVKAGDGTTISEEETYVYTKVDPTLAQKVYFDNSSYSWSKVYCYVYDDTASSTTPVRNAAWPGVAMTLDDATGYYVYEVPDNLENAKIIFTESSSATKNRYPADQKPGLDLEGVTKLFKANHVLETYSPATPTPTTTPTVTPTVEPTVEPTIEPTVEPTIEPTVEPTTEPTVEPTVEPTIEPTVEPTAEPTTEPTVEPTVEPTTKPTVEPTTEPTVEPTVEPTTEPTVTPTTEPTVEPTVEPTTEPTIKPTTGPTVKPTTEPTVEPTTEPTVEPTVIPTVAPTVEPTREPTVCVPSKIPTVTITVAPTKAPTKEPTKTPTRVPTTTPKTYCLTYNVNTSQEVSGNYIVSAKYKAGQNAKVQGTLISKNMFFAGWNTKADGSGKSYQWGKNIRMTSDITLYAQWKQVYTSSQKLTYKVTGKNTVSCTGIQNTKKSKISVPNTVTYCGVTYKVTGIAEKAFAKKTKLKTVVVGNNVKTVGTRAFYGCKNLKRITLGTGLTTVEEQAFGKVKTGCVVTINSKKLKTVGEEVNYKSRKMTVKVPKSKLKTYKRMFQENAENSLTVKVK